MRRMYRRAAHAFADVFPVVLTICVLLALMDLLLEGTGALGGILIAYGFMALYFHRSVLLGEKLTWRDSFRTRSRDGQDHPIGPFLWRFICWWLFCGAVFFGLIFLFSDTTNAWKDADPELTGETIALFLMLVTVVLVLPVLAMVGTVFPAAAIRGDATLGAAWRRGRRTFWRTLGRLWAGNILFFVVANGVLIAASFTVFPDQNIPPVLGIVEGSLFELVGMFTAALTAAALSLAYEEVEATASA